LRPPCFAWYSASSARASARSTDSAGSSSSVLVAAVSTITMSASRSLSSRGHSTSRRPSYNTSVEAHVSHQVGVDFAQAYGVCRPTPLFGQMHSSAPLALSQMSATPA
jgi:hypothetical protein